MNADQILSSDFICKGLYKRKFADGSVEVIDGNQNTIIPRHQYSGIEYLEGILIVSKNCLKGICNINGKELCPCVNEDVATLINNHQRYFSIKENGKYGLFDVVDVEICVECISAKRIFIREFKHSGRYEAISTISRKIFGFIPWFPKYDSTKLKK